MSFHLSRARSCGAILGLLMATGPMALTAQVDDNHIYSYRILDRLEFGFEDESNLVLWEAQAWIGGDFTKLWIKTDGERLTEVGQGTAELQALWSRLISGFWDLQIGGRVDVVSDGVEDRARGFAVVGFEGLAPYWFELVPALFVSHQGDVSFRLTASYDVFVTQRLILQGRVEGEAAAQDVPDFGVGSGLTSTDTGIRLRYEIKREFAPYLGWRWERRFGETAELARAANEAVGNGYLVAGLRIWF
jgi:copper resistance protein B